MKITVIVGEEKYEAYESVTPNGVKGFDVVGHEIIDFIPLEEATQVLPAHECKFEELTGLPKKMFEVKAPVCANCKHMMTRALNEQLGNQHDSTFAEYVHLYDYGFCLLCPALGFPVDYGCGADPADTQTCFDFEWRE